MLLWSDGSTERLSEGTTNDMTGSSSWITAMRRLALYLRGRGICAYCGKDLHDAKPSEMGLDHLEDLICGGGHKGANHKSDNLVLACRACNSGRGAKPWREYATGGAIERIEAQRAEAMSPYLTLAKAMLAEGQKWSDR